jgi:hypothetical protein
LRIFKTGYNKIYQQNFTFKEELGHDSVEIEEIKVDKKKFDETEIVKDKN